MGYSVDPEFPVGVEKYVPLESVVVGERDRDVSEPDARELSVTIEKEGLINAITVRPLNDNKFELAAGAHRLRAHQILGWSKIRANVRMLSDEEMKLVEASENLFRHELTAAQRMLSSGLWMDAYQAAHPELQHGGDRKSEYAKIKLQNSQLERADQVLSRKTGRSQRSIYEDQAVFKALGPKALKEVAGSSIGDNASQLSVLAKLPPEDRPSIIGLICDGTVATVKQAIQWNPDMPEPVKKSEAVIALEKLEKAWEAADTRIQKKFLRQIGAVFE